MVELEGLHCDGEAGALHVMVGATAVTTIVCDDVAMLPAESVAVFFSIVRHNITNTHTNECNRQAVVDIVRRDHNIAI